MCLVIRNAAEHDLMTVYGFVCRLEETVFDITAFTIIFLDNIADANHCYLVAENVQGVIAGYISCHTQLLLHHGGRVGEIQELYVDIHYRKLGTGKALITAAEAYCMDKQCLLLEVTAQHKRTSAHHFYANNGFACTHKKFVKHL